MDDPDDGAGAREPEDALAVERAEIAEALVLGMNAGDVSHSERRMALRAAIDVAVRSTDAGEIISIPAAGTRECVRGLGREAMRLNAARGR